MQRVKKRTFAGAVCDQIVYNISDRARLEKSEPRPRFKSEEEREAHKLAISKRKHARLFNENYGPTSIYGTLTFDDENEVHTFREARYIRDLYFRRLKYHYPKARINIYIGRGKKTHRIHLHIVAEGIPEEDIVKLWDCGEVVRTEHLREHNYYDGVDHGRDYTGLANYLFDHWTPEQGGHRWKATRNLQKPEEETPTIAARNYSIHRPPIAPKGYILVEAKETRFGYLYFKYVLDPNPRKGRKKRLID